jgi:hypothetical protein
VALRFFEGPLDLLRLRRAPTFQLVAENAVSAPRAPCTAIRSCWRIFEPELQVIDFSDQAQPRE